MSQEQFDELLELIEDETKDEEDFDLYHGMTLEYYENGGYLVTSGDSSDPDHLSQEFLEKFGKCIGDASMPYLIVGYSFSASRNAPGSCGGGSFRIYPDGSMVYPDIIWPEDKVSKKVADA